MPSANRSGPCVAVVAGRTLFVVDAGTNGARNLQGVIGWPPGRIAAVFLTHYHSDHIDGLGEMGLLRWVGGGIIATAAALRPEGLRDVAAGFERAYQFDARYRVAHHGRRGRAARRSGIRAAPVRDTRAADRRSCSASTTASASARSASSTSRFARGRLPLRLRRPLAVVSRRHEEVGERARAGARCRI
jgi:ribonuclease BN (tRNA processing enzyme)